MRAKTFMTGEVVLFQRKAGATWELGEYIEAATRGMFESLGWHCVRDNADIKTHPGFAEGECLVCGCPINQRTLRPCARGVHWVPTKRIKHSPGPRKEGVIT